MPVVHEWCAGGVRDASNGLPTLPARSGVRVVSKYLSKAQQHFLASAKAGPRNIADTVNWAPQSLATAAKQLGIVPTKTCLCPIDV